MLKKKYRLGKVQGVAFGRPIHAPYFYFRIAQNNLLHNRFSCAVSKRVDKRAVVRNKVRRAAYSCLERVTGKMTKGYDILFSIKKEAIGIPGKALCATIQSLFEKEGIVCQ